MNTTNKHVCRKICTHWLYSQRHNNRRYYQPDARRPGERDEKGRYHWNYVVLILSCPLDPVITQNANKIKPRSNHSKHAVGQPQLHPVRPTILDDRQTLPPLSLSVSPLLSRPAMLQLIKYK